MPLRDVAHMGIKFILGGSESRWINGHKQLFFLLGLGWLQIDFGHLIFARGAAC